jgi:diguanylate cyclase (GGDEF)-like protein
MSSLAPARLLVVDDDIGTIRLLASIVRDFGEVFFATDGAEALAMIGQQQPDLVLLDAEMPGMDGFDVCRAIKSDPALADLPVLFITAHSDVEIETQALELGAVDFIIKPPSPAIVRARVKTQLMLKQRTDALVRLASVDGLTGVANRRSFDEALALEWRRACRSRSPLSLMLIDVDYFKRFNDRYGHQAGDDCLRAIASTLATTSRRSGELVARYGGEEFAIVLPGCDAPGAAAFAGLLRTNVAAQHIPHAGSDVCDTVTVSIGIATLVAGGALPASPDGPDLSPADADSTGASLLAAADRALYEAKRTGRDRAVGSLPVMVAARHG